MGRDYFFADKQPQAGPMHGRGNIRVSEKPLKQVDQETLRNPRSMVINGDE
jgi:hypothetical protein